LFGGGGGRGAEGEKRRRRAGGAGGKFHSGCASPAKARAREEAPKLPRRIAQNAAPRYLFPAHETIHPLLEEDTARARGKKLVILALRYFSATAGDALSSGLPFRPEYLTFKGHRYITISLKKGSVL
jgi:hypothetical protein